MFLLTGMAILALLHMPAISAQPQRLKNEMDWGVTAYQQGNDDLALRYFQKTWAPQSQLVGLKVVDPAPLIWQAKCYARLGAVAEAATQLNEALALAQPGSQTYAFAMKALLELFPSKPAETTTTLHTFRQTMGESSLTLNHNPRLEKAAPAIRWQQPIAVWVQPEMPVSLSFKQRQRLQVSLQEVERLVRQWQPALPSNLPITVTPNVSAANVRIEWIDSIKSATPASANSAFTSGTTQWEVDSHHIAQAVVKIAVRGPQGQPRAKMALLQTTLHELGHALGLAEHSTQPGDIMAAHGVGSYHVSPNDLARLQALYSSSDSSPTSTTLTVLP